MAGRAVVTKSSPVVVVPSEPGGDTIALSSFDMCMLPFPTVLLLAFDRPIDNPVETVKKALSRALAHYYPVAGRLDGKGGIACTGEGVPFVGASASCALDEATMGAMQQMDLTVRYPGVFCRDVDPLVMVQVTEFSCGGFVVGITWNHLLADGAGIGQFLQAVGELARGASRPAVAPVRHWDDNSLRRRLPASMATMMMSIADNNRSWHLARHDIAVPLSLISRIKEESGGCTAFEAVAAIIWRCRTRAAMSPAGDPDRPAPLKFPCNVRALVGASAGYYGNCIFGQVEPATSGAVASSSIADLARLIRRAKESVPDLLPSSDDDNGGIQGGGGQHRLELEWYSRLAVVSWMNLGFDGADFGGGRPVRVMWHEDQTVVPCCMVCSPCLGDALYVSSLCVKPEHADAFVGELAMLSQDRIVVL